MKEQEERVGENNGGMDEWMKERKERVRKE